MKFLVFNFKFLVIGMLAAALASVARGEITATTTPGYVFSPNERPTTATLNQLGNPTIHITGTLGGTNVSLGAGTVSGTMLMDSVAGSNLTWNTASPRGLVVTHNAITPSELAASVAGNGLAGGNGTALSVTTAGYFLSSTNDALRIICPQNNALIGNAQGFATNASFSGQFLVGGTSISLSNFVTAEYALGSGGVIANTNHNLGATPQVIFWRLICKTADVGYEVGDEVDVSAFYNAASFKPQFAPGGNSTNLFLVEFSTTINVRRKDTGADDTITASRWRAKGYCRP